MNNNENVMWLGAFLMQVKQREAGTHTRARVHAHVENRETRPEQEKRLKENSSGAAEQS